MRGAELAGRDCCRPEAGDDEPGRDVREPGRMFQRSAGGQAHREHGNDRVARAGHVGHFARGRLQQHFGRVAADRSARTCRVHPR